MSLSAKNIQAFCGWLSWFVVMVVVMFYGIFGYYGGIF